MAPYRKHRWRELLYGSTVTYDIIRKLWKRVNAFIQLLRLEKALGKIDVYDGLERLIMLNFSIVSRLLFHIWTRP